MAGCPAALTAGSTCAGIVGLSTAATLLRQDSGLSMAIVDRAVPCAGATGAGKSACGSLRRGCHLETLTVLDFHCPSLQDSRLTNATCCMKVKDIFGWRIGASAMRRGCSRGTASSSGRSCCTTGWMVPRTGAQCSGR